MGVVETVNKYSDFFTAIKRLIVFTVIIYVCVTMYRMYDDVKHIGAMISDFVTKGIPDAAKGAVSSVGNVASDAGHAASGVLDKIGFLRQ